MSNAEARTLILSCFKFIVGEEDSHPDIPALKRFINGRSRVTELLQMRELHSVIKTSYKKRELVEYFCNLPAGSRHILINKFPDIIVAIPADFKLFKLDKPKHISYRFANFGGATVEYPVFSIISFFERLGKAQYFANSYREAGK